MKGKKILLIMPPFWDPICPPQGIVCLKAYLENAGYEAHIDDFNVDGKLFSLQRKYFELGMTHFPHWRFLNIFRNGPRYFARHQLAFLMSGRRTARYKKLISLILNFDGRSACTDHMIDAFDSIIKESFNIVRSKAGELVERIKPDVVGCTMLESTFPAALEILKTVKETDPKTRTILGGPGAVVGNKVEDGVLQKVIEKCGWVDAIIYGEGEQLLEKYLEGSFGSRRIITVEDLENVMPMADKEDALLDINDMPAQNYENLPLIRYLWASVFTSRGCPFKCAFCFENCYWMRFRAKKVEKVFDEMKAIEARYGKDKFYICDSLVNHIASQLSETLLSRGVRYKWDCYMRITADCLNAGKVKLWADGGMKRVRIGVESASPRVLKLMNKDISPEHTKQSLVNFANNGICTTTLWIAGFPGETDRDFSDSMRFLEENHKFIYQADIWEFICSPVEFSASAPAQEGFSTASIYPDEFDDLLLIKYYDLKNKSSLQERFDRIKQFEELRTKLGIANPYSLNELIEAHMRWVRLGYQKNGESFI